MGIGKLAECSAQVLNEAEDLLLARRLEPALKAFSEAERASADPDRCAAGRWTAYMLIGKFAAAWEESDAIRRRGAPDPHRFWNGETIDGKRLIVRCLHGLGDAVQMLRYLPMLQGRCGSVTVEVPPHLLPLAPYFIGADQIITWGEQAPAVPPAWDLQVEVMELPYVLRTNLSDLPLTTNYLRVPGPSPLSRRSNSHMPRVGLVWAASEWDPTRCLPMDCVERLLGSLGVEFWILQGGKQHALAREFLALRGIRDGAEFGEGLVPLAAAISAMDLVLTVDTLAAHMAGAIGRTAWVLLQKQADWRWMCERSDSPWYPSLKLWRQPSQGDWETLTTEVCTALTLWAGV